jgi:mannose/fructose/N-acetylgalactosamine-specific phosphotransferase system component IID
MRSFSSKQNNLHKGEEMFDPSLGDFLVMIAMAVMYFHVGRIVGMRVGYLKGRKAVREYYESKEKVRV